MYIENVHSPFVFTYPELCTPKLAFKAGSTDTIDHYEVAAGTSRTDSTKITSVRDFTNVGLETKHTFIRLRLRMSTVYYFTVRAHSKSGAVAQITSNGVKIRRRTHIIKGQVEVAKYVVQHRFSSFSRI